MYLKAGGEWQGNRDVDEEYVTQGPKWWTPSRSQVDKICHLKIRLILNSPSLVVLTFRQKKSALDLFFCLSSPLYLHVF